MDAEIEFRPTGFNKASQVARKYLGIILSTIFMLGISSQRKRQGGKVCGKAITVKMTCAVQSQPDTWWISTNFWF